MPADDPKFSGVYNPSKEPKLFEIAHLIERQHTYEPPQVLVSNID